ncbi:DUF1801 domain-containing protein [Ahrensia kielensis]|uniref:DUF1801 domain-containing protein n=1 Tax=Ahrensia kielensis TaxID=76980 RepID=UPI00146D198C|nr:DUF1801 domain-containing protein [Ahrensia kielensis]
MSDLYNHFLQERVLANHKLIVLRFCEQMARIAPEASLRMRGGTEKYYSVPVYKVKRDIVAISPTKAGITFSFTAGGKFEDPFEILTGSGKRSRTVRVSSIDEYPNIAMAHFIKQAVAFDLA